VCESQREGDIPKRTLPGGMGSGTSFKDRGGEKDPVSSLLYTVA
jgi:hypothetical protein